jgi:hypothetical protein
MSVGIGGAGSKIAALFDKEHTTAVNISQVELDKVDVPNKILAVAHSAKGQFMGSGKNPAVGRTASISIEEEVMGLAKGDILFSSTGGGTGSGIVSVLLDKITNQESVLLNDATVFAFLLPCLNKEPIEYVENTIDFLLDSIAPAIDSGNTGNIILFSNKLKFDKRVSEGDFNKKISNSLSSFYSIPKKSRKYSLLDGHIDEEDFKIYTSKPYFNHFMEFDYTPDKPFVELLNKNQNPLLLLPEKPIEAMFLLEVPKKKQANYFYNILDYFADDNVIPIYSVVLNEELTEPRLTLSMLYSRKPKELVDDFKDMANKMSRKKIKKSIDQYVKLERDKFNIDDEVKKIEKENESVEGVLDVLKRLRKLR